MVLSNIVIHFNLFDPLKFFIVEFDVLYIFHDLSWPVAESIYCIQSSLSITTRSLVLNCLSRLGRPVLLKIFLPCQLLNDEGWDVLKL